MKKIAVFDLDGTLLSTDSFRLLVMSNLLSSPALLGWACARATRIVGRKKFVEAAHRALRPALSKPAYREKFIQSLHAFVQPKILDQAQQFQSEDVTTVLLSASPHDYVSELGKALGFQHAFGSNWADGRYVHLYGEEKVRFLEQTLPKHQWIWHYSAADSESDKPLLSRFEIAEIVKHA